MNFKPQQFWCESYFLVSPYWARIRAHSSTAQAGRVVMATLLGVSEKVFINVALKATKELLATELETINLCQMTRMAPEQVTSSLNCHTTRMIRLCTSADLTCINSSEWWVLSGIRVRTHDTQATTIWS
ncbi:hypothetical protein TNCV_4786411 [Trichonephila clavipes]|nr:hypothetical protein TNCV_4786411 [Trichonephila clavipes]